MNVDNLREQLKIDEGVKYEIYNDHLGYPTFGIGHLVRDTDPAAGAELGTPGILSHLARTFVSLVKQGRGSPGR